MPKRTSTTPKGDTKTTKRNSSTGKGKTDYRTPGNSTNNKTTHFSGTIRRSRTKDGGDHQISQDETQAWDPKTQTGRGNNPGSFLDLFKKK